ncbi:MAG: acylphosphatase [Thermodesulfobacteriota bacterium]
MDKLRAHIIIVGQVQGVFFRSSTQDEAASRGVFGWVRNNPDSTVEALFEGPEDQVKEMLQWCENGPSEARVTEVNINYEEVTGEFSDFKIYTDPYLF